MFRTIRRRLTTVETIANVCGAFVSYMYFTVIDPIPSGETSVQAIRSEGLIVFGIAMVVLFAIAWVWGRRVFGGINEWGERLQAGESIDQVPDDVRRQVLNYVPNSTLINFTVWILAGLFFSSGGQTLGWRYWLRIFVGIVGIGGVLTTAILFFVQDLLWRQVIPVFFPEGSLSAVKAFRLPVLGRLLIVFLLVGLWPAAVLVSTSLERAQVLVTSTNPDIVLANLAVVEYFILATSVVASVGMALFMTRSVVGPLRTMQAAMSRVKQGEFDVQVPVLTNDELGFLAENFNQMTAGLRQGEMLRTLLNLYVSPEVARQAMEDGVTLGGRQVECTVLFSDIRGFTSLSESMPPERLISLLNSYMSAMVAVIVEQGGLVNKFGGDSILAVFGTPLNPAHDHAARAIQTAQDMLKGLAEFNREQDRSGGPVLHIGIGIATGPVVAGNVGGQERIEYTVIGDTVNLASRLQEMTKESGWDVLISGEAYRAAAQVATLDAESLPPVSVRGKSEPVQVYGMHRKAQVIP